MGNTCVTHPPSEHGGEQLEAFSDLLRIANSKNCTNHHIVTNLVQKCQFLAKTKSIQFIYSKTCPIPEEQRTPISSKYGGSLPIKIQGIELGTIRFDQRKIPETDRQSMVILKEYAVQIMERNYLRLQAASVISVVGAQRECKSIPTILASISSVIQDSLRCESVCLFRVDASAETIIQLHPTHSTISSFDEGILGHVCKHQQFIVYNDDREREASGVGHLSIEIAKDNKHEVESMLCVPIMSNEMNEIDGIILALNKGDGAPFGLLGIDMLQILAVEVGDILENFATKINLTLEDAVQEGHGSASSLLQYYKELAQEKSMFSADRPQREMIKSVFQAAQVVAKRRSVVDMFKQRMDQLLLTSDNSKCSSNDRDGKQPNSNETNHGLREQKEDTKEDSTEMNGNHEVNVIPIQMNSKHDNNSISNSNPPRFSHTFSEIIRKAIQSGDLTNSASALQDIVNISFDPFEKSKSELGEIAVSMFLDLNLVKTLKVEAVPFSNFIKEIMGLYRNSNPYHNVYHGFSVLSFAYSFIKKTDLISKFPALDVFALLISALCHDVDHPGNTNAFEIATDSELARQHNDQSVLENHHCNVTFNAMYKSGCNFMTEFSNEDRKRLRKMVIQSILATDMSHHFELCSTLDQIDKGQFQQSLVKPEKTDKFKQIICNVFVHTADLTAPVQPLQIALKWGKRVAKEFANQVEKEQELGLESLPMMQGLEDQENFLKSQRGFYKFVLRPLFKSVSRLWPELNVLYLQLLNNEQYISDEADRLEADRLGRETDMKLARIHSLSLKRDKSRSGRTKNATSSTRSFKFTRSETRILDKSEVTQIFEQMDTLQIQNLNAS